MHVNMGHFIYL